MAFASETAAQQLLTQEMLAVLVDLCCDGRPAAADVQARGREMFR